MAMDGKVGDHATHDPLRSLKLHSSTSRERYGKPTAKKVDLFAVGMVMAKQYNTTHVKIRRKVNVKMLRNIGIFRSLSENLLKKLADEFLTKSYHTSDKIIKQNNYGEKLFILLHGVIGIHVEGVGVVNQVSPFTALGERSLLMHQKTSATCFAMTPCLVAHITRNVFDEVLGGMAADLEAMTRLRSTIQDSMKDKEARMTGINDRVMMRIGMFQMRIRSRLKIKREKKARQRMETLKRWDKVAWVTKCILLTRAWCFRGIDPVIIGLMAQCSSLKKYKPQEIVYNAKEWAKSCYIVLSGSVELRAKPQQSNTNSSKRVTSRLLAQVGPRMCFGDLEIVPDGDKPGYRRRCCMAKVLTASIILSMPYEAVLYCHTLLEQKKKNQSGEGPPPVPRTLRGLPRVKPEAQNFFSNIIYEAIEKTCFARGESTDHVLGMEIGGPLELMRAHQILDDLPPIEEILCSLCVQPKKYVPRSIIPLSSDLVFLVSGMANVMLNGKKVSTVSDGSVFSKDSSREDYGVELIAATNVAVLCLEPLHLDLLNSKGVQQLYAAINLPKVWRNVKAQLPSRVIEDTAGVYHQVRPPKSQDPWGHSPRARNSIQAPPTGRMAAMTRQVSINKERFDGEDIRTKSKKSTLTKERLDGIIRAMQLANTSVAELERNKITRPRTAIDPAVNTAHVLRRPGTEQRRRSAISALHRKYRHRNLRTAGGVGIDGDASHDSGGFRHHEFRGKNVSEGVAISSLSTRKQMVLKLRPVSMAVPSETIQYNFPLRKKVSPRQRMLHQHYEHERENGLRF